MNRILVSCELIEFNDGHDPMFLNTFANGDVEYIRILCGDPLFYNKRQFESLYFELRELNPKSTLFVNSAGFIHQV